MPQVYFSLPADDLEAVDHLAEARFDGNRSQVLREAVTEYLHGQAKRAIDPDMDEAIFAATTAMNAGQPPSEVARAVVRAATAHLVLERELTAEGAGPLLDWACRNGQCELCLGAPCQHGCHSNAKEPGQ